MQKAIIWLKHILLERLVTFSLAGIILVSSAFISDNAQASLNNIAIALQEVAKPIANSTPTNIEAVNSLQTSMDDAKAEIDKFALETQRDSIES